ncbi:MAG: hypothetical protein R3182_11320 [Draconibacterium sp.]|nr:hypothetical protein [Draconibacterium sp.]
MVERKTRYTTIARQSGKQADLLACEAIAAMTGLKDRIKRSPWIMV